MIQIRLLDHPSKFSKHEGMYRPCLVLEIWDLCISKAEHIWHLNFPIMKYETYWYRYLTVGSELLEAAGQNYAKLGG